MKKVLLVLFIFISLFSPVSLKAEEISSDYFDDYSSLFVVWASSNYGITFDANKSVLDDLIIDHIKSRISNNFISLDEFNGVMKDVETRFNNEKVLRFDVELQNYFKSTLSHLVNLAGENLILSNHTYTITETGESDITEFIPSFQRIDPAYSRSTAVLSGNSNQYKWKFSFNNGVASLDGWYVYDLIDSLDYASFRIKPSNIQSYTDSIFHINSLYAGGSSSSQPNFPYELYSFNLSDFDSNFTFKLDSYQKDGFYNINYIIKTFSTAEARAEFIANLTDSNYFFNSVSNYTLLDRDRNWTLSGNQYILIIKRTTEIPFKYTYRECKTETYYRFMMFKNFTGTKSVLNSDLSTCSDIEFTDYSSDLVSPLNFHDIEPKLTINGHSVLTGDSISFSVGNLPSDVSQNGNYYQIGQDLSSFNSLSDLVDSINLDDSYSVKYYGRYTNTELDLTDSTAIQNETNLGINNSLNGDLPKNDQNDIANSDSEISRVFDQNLKVIDDFKKSLNFNNWSMPSQFNEASEFVSESTNSFFNIDFFHNYSWVIPLFIVLLVLFLIVR